MAAWPYRVLFALPIPTADLVDFPVKVPIVADADIGAECLATGYDLRFTAADGTTLLPYERESWAGGGGAPVEPGSATVSKTVTVTFELR